MQQLTTIIQRFFPEESIINKSNIKLIDTWKSGLSFGKYFHLKPLPMVETDKKLYFDKRVPVILQSFISMLVGPIWLTAFLFIIQLVFKFNYPIIFYGIAIMGGIFVGIINLFINIFTIQNIFAVDKSWITKRQKEADTEIITGHIPSGSNTYFLISFLSKEQKATLSLLDRFPGRLLLDTNFTLKIQSK
ncbi:MAG: hypothetical protein WCJ58_00220 [bacterium]